MKGNIIKINENQLNFLLKTVIDNHLREKLKQLIENDKNPSLIRTNKYILELSALECDTLLDELTMTLTSIGFNEEQELTTDGSMVEEIIDLLTN